LKTLCAVNVAQNFPRTFCVISMPGETFNIKGRTMTDRELLDAFIRAGTEERERAFTVLVGRYWRMVYATAHRIVDDAQLAEDVSQSVFLLLSGKAANLPTRTVLSGWLYACATHAARNTLRKRQRMMKQQQQIEISPEPVAQAPDERFDWRELKPHVDRALAALPQGQRDAVVLRLILQRPPEEAARELQCSEGALSMRLNRGVEALRESLKRQRVEISSGALSAALLQNAIPTSVPAAAPLSEAKLMAGAKTVTGVQGWIGAGVGAAVLSGVLLLGVLCVRSGLTSVLTSEFKAAYPRRNR
jgi:RNA polymerase sigma factor (sigma-70 family)